MEDHKLSRNKVWILDGVDLDHSKEIEIYKENNIDYLLSNEETLEEDLERFGKDADVIVVEAGIKIDETLLDKLSACKGIVAFGTGFDHIDVQAAKERNIQVGHLNYCSEEVSDHTLSLILTLLRRLPHYNKDLKSGIFNPMLEKPIHRFSAVTVGILGFGRIAQNVAKRLKPFGFNIIVHDEYVDESVFEELGVTKVSLEQLLTQSNLITLHVPLTNETRNLLNEENMRKLPKDAIIVNTCRGEIIDEDALVRLIKEGHISAAGLDVFHTEPPNTDSELFKLDEIIVSPHAAYYSIESVEEMQTQAAESAIRMIEGKKPLFPVN